MLPRHPAVDSAGWGDRSQAGGCASLPLLPFLGGSAAHGQDGKGRSRELQPPWWTPRITVVVLCGWNLCPYYLKVILTQENE